MIRFFEKKDEHAVVAIWAEAFGDKESEILKFLHTFGQYMLVLEFEGKPVSMLTLLPVTANGEKGRYVYAVATEKSSRGKGFAGELIEYAKQYIEENGEKFLVILPQSESLFGFYGKFGFYTLKCAIRIEKTGCISGENAASAEKISAIEYFECRKEYFSGRKYVEWDVKMLNFFAEIYDGCYLKLSDGNKKIGFAFCYSCGNKVVVPELLAYDGEFAALNAICRLFGKDNAACNKEAENGKNTAMIYPESFSDSYFGIGMN